MAEQTKSNGHPIRTTIELVVLIALFYYLYKAYQRFKQVGFTFKGNSGFVLFGGGGNSNGNAGGADNDSTTNTQGQAGNTPNAQGAAGNTGTNQTTGDATQGSNAAGTAGNGTSTTTNPSQGQPGYVYDNTSSISIYTTPGGISIAYYYPNEQTGYLSPSTGEVYQDSLFDNNILANDYSGYLSENTSSTDNDVADFLIILLKQRNLLVTPPISNPIITQLPNS